MFFTEDYYQTHQPILLRFLIVNYLDKEFKDITMLFSKLKKRRVDFQELYKRKVRNHSESLKKHLSNTYLTVNELENQLETTNSYLLKKITTLNYLTFLENNCKTLNNPEQVKELKTLKQELKTGIVESTYRIKYFSKLI